MTANSNIEFTGRNCKQQQKSSRTSSAGSERPSARSLSDPHKAQAATANSNIQLYKLQRQTATYSYIGCDSKQQHRVIQAATANSNIQLQAVAANSNIESYRL